MGASISNTQAGEEEPETERLVEIRTLIERLGIKTNLLGHHASNRVPITGALPNDKAAILTEFYKAHPFQRSSRKPAATGYGICDRYLFRLSTYSFRVGFFRY